jgi:hypothetical protein
MATNLIKVTGQTAIVWADTTDYASTLSGLVRTDQIDLTSVGSGSARQGAKADLGATRATKYAVFVCMEIVSAAASAESIEIYWAGSPSATAANANPGGASGADAAYTGTAGDSLIDSLPQLEYVGALITTSDNTGVPQYQKVGVLFGDEIQRYGMPVVVNNSTGVLEGNATEMLVALVPILPDIQAAA